jgi:AcrR family transcriptional regulator
VSQLKRSSGRPASTAEGGGQAVKLILDAAEWLFAEHGISAVSNRQIGAAAGQGNTSAVGYYFGSKDELIRALIRRFEEEAAVRRDAMLSQLGNSPELRDWIMCLVLPYTDNLAARKPPTWYARLNAQINADPVLRAISLEEANTASYQQVIVGLEGAAPELPAAVRQERVKLAGHLIVQACADYESSLADGVPVRGRTWRKIGSALVDALAGFWSASVAGHPVSG